MRRRVLMILIIVVLAIIAFEVIMLLSSKGSNSGIAFVNQTPVNGNSATGNVASQFNGLDLNTTPNQTDVVPGSSSDVPSP